MDLDLHPPALPLRSDSSGVIRIGGSRVTLESLVHAYLEGESAEGINDRFPTLELADIHAVIAWYLRNRRVVDVHMRKWRMEARVARVAAGRRSDHDGLRERLFARRLGRGGTPLA